MSSFQQLKASRAARTQGTVAKASSSSSSSSSVSTSKTAVPSDVPETESPSQPAHTTPLPGEASTSTSTATPEAAVEVTGNAFGSAAQDEVVAAELGRLNADLELAQYAGKGRGLRLKADRPPCQPGQELISAEPFACSLSSQCLDAFCQTCFHSLLPYEPHQARPSPVKKLRCSSCKIIHYCSPACQKRDWAVHKLECKALKAFGEHSEYVRNQAGPSPSKDVGALTKSFQSLSPYEQGQARKTQPRGVPEMTVRLAARLIWQRKVKCEEWWTLVTSLCAHRHKEVTPYERQLGTSTVELVHYLLCASVSPAELPTTDSSAFLGALGFDSTRPLLNLLASIQNNGVTLTTPDLSPIGISLQAHIALANHSCLPNAVILSTPRTSGEDQNKILRLIALKKIDAGEEILASYCDLSDSRPVRQKHLQESYHFLCGCLASCKAVTETVPALLKTQIESSRKVLEAVQSLQSPEVVWLKASKVLPALLRLFPSSTFPAHALLNEAMTALMAMSRRAESRGTPAAEVFESDCLDEAARAGLLLAASVQAGDGYCFAQGNPYRANMIAMTGMVLVDAAHAVGGANPDASSSSSEARIGGNVGDTGDGDGVGEEEVDASTIAALRNGIGFHSVLREFTPALPPLGSFRDAEDEFRERRMYAGRRVALGAQLLRQAHAELELAFGKGEGGGPLGRLVLERLHQVMTELEAAGAPI
ncbi:hypothetical protein OC842_001185 [Tilletia horrida]|uniref:MYND-type domain-containing protein n=1 Tax=Tilletia horrida TaxID=155126 RepID=A0AAN6GFI2_9BASI|nr:hypothetical protein OC842_001185 [Tilletia horrida]